MTPPKEPVFHQTREEIQAMRRSYGEKGLTEDDVDADPIIQFHRWLAEAALNPLIVEANAMVLSTVDDQVPQSRTVLLKELSELGFTFFTNYESAKGRAISGNPNVSLLFPWYAMERQVIIRGDAEKVAEKTSREYFATRPWNSQIGAWASSQSQDLESREQLQALFDEFAMKFPEGSDVPKPAKWGGYLVKPRAIEFWQGRQSRLHDRLIFTAMVSGWQLSRLHP